MPAFLPLRASFDREARTYLKQKVLFSGRPACMLIFLTLPHSGQVAQDVALTN